MSDIKIHLRKADGRRVLRQFNGHNRKSNLYQRKYCDRERVFAFASTAVFDTLVVSLRYSVATASLCTKSYQLPFLPESERCVKRRELFSAAPVPRCIG